MELSRSEYPAMLASLQPHHAVEVLQDRIKHVSKLNSEVADWLQERRRVEEAYALGLRKLSQKRPPDTSSDMGIFTTPWQKLVHCAEALADSHHRLAQKIEADVERPLHIFALQNRDMQAMTTIQGNLMALAKDVDNAQKKAEKLQAKGNKSTAERVAMAASEVENANSQWVSQAPYVFEKLQAMDESRLNHLRDALTQFQTHEVDQVERSRATAEEGLEAILSVETADEIQAFQVRALQEKPKLRNRRYTLPGQSARPNDMPPPPVPTPQQPLQETLASTPSRTVTPQPALDATSLRSGSVEQEKKRSSAFAGLKRMGTKLGRTPKKDKKVDEPYSRPDMPDRRSSSHLSSAFASLGSRAKSKTNEQRMPAPVAEDESPTSVLQRTNEEGSSSLRRTPSATNLNGNGASHDADEVHTVPSTNGNPTPLTTPPPLESVNSSSSLATEVPTTGLDSVVDSDGFSFALSASDPITQAEQEAAGYSTEPALKLDIRSAPIQEEDGNVKDAFDNVANTLRAQVAPNKRTSTIRGRRDVRNTILVADPASFPDFGLTPSDSGPSSAPLASSPPTSTASLTNSTGAIGVPPMKNPHLSNFLAEDAASSDTLSIRSGRSLGSIASMTTKHPDMHGPGLNASIIERVNAKFKHGNLIHAGLQGEIALAYNHQDLSIPFGMANVRIDKFVELERVAVNPMYIDDDDDGVKNGYYTVSLSGYTSTTIAFKYQVNIPTAESASKHVPVTLVPQWRIDSKQASVIVKYFLQPGFQLPEGRNNITFANLTILVYYYKTGSKVMSIKATHGGRSHPEHHAIVWRLGEVTLTKGAPAVQLKARFFADGETKPGHAEARWDIDLCGGHTAGLGSGINVSMLARNSGSKDESDPFADGDADASVDKETAEGEWTIVPAIKKLQSGVDYRAV